MSDVCYKPLGALCQVLSSKRIYASEYVETGVPFYRSKEVIQKHNGEPINTELFITEEHYSKIEEKFGVPQEGDMLMTSVGTLGVPYIVQRGEKFYFKDGNLTWYRNFTDELSSQYLFYIMDSETGKELIKTVTIGSSQAALTIDGMKGLLIPCPPIEYQKKLVGILSAYDSFIKNNNRCIAILEEMAQRLYREWFVHFRFPGHENTPMVESELGMIPEGWMLTPFLKTVKVNPRYPKPQTDSYIYVEMADLNNFNMIVSSDKRRSGYKGSKFTNGDTLVARITPCLENGKTGYVQCLQKDEIGIGSTEFIVLHADSILPEIVYLIARQNDFRDMLIKSMSGASGRQRADISALGDYYIPLPPSSVQKEFSRFVHPIFTRIQKSHMKNQNLRKTRDLLLPRLISGDIDVSKIDIDVEDVSK